MRRTRVSGWLCGWLCCAAAAAQEGEVVRDVVITNMGPGRVDTNFVFVHVSARVGETLSATALSRDVRGLMETGRFADARVETRKAGGGVRVTYLVRNRMKLVGDVEVGGADHFSVGKVRDILGLAAGDYVDEDVMGARAQALRNRYREDHYLNASVLCRLAEADPGSGQARARVDIREGDRACITKVVFSGNTNMPAGALRALLKVRPWWKVSGWFEGRRPCDDIELDRIRDEVRDAYLKGGFLDVAVRMPQADTNDTDRIVVLVNVEEGVRYKFGVVSNDAPEMPARELKNRVKVRTGEDASVDDVRHTVQALQDYYGSRGYADAKVECRENPDKARGVNDVTFRVIPGPRVRIRNIAVEGNQTTKDKVIRREILVHPGEMVDTVRLKRSERILSNLGWFSSVRYGLKEISGYPEERDAVFEVEEKRTGTITAGIAYSDEDSVLGYAEISQGNFDIADWPPAGGGQKLRLYALAGEKRSSYEIEFVEPWFLDRKLSAGIKLYATSREYTGYDLDRLGATFSLTKALTSWAKAKFEYTLEKTQYDDVTDTNTYYRLDEFDTLTGETFSLTQQLDYVSSTLGLSLIFDGRNSTLWPTRGHYVVLSGSLSGGPLGQDLDIYRLNARATQYVPLWPTGNKNYPMWLRHVLKLRAQCQVVDEYGGTDSVPYGERLFAGGRNLRGFDYRDVGPKVVRTSGTSAVSKEIGGETLAVGTAEYTIPLASLLSSNPGFGIRLAMFYDIGNVWEEAYEFDFGRMASSAGAGLRLDIPGFPIRIDRAWAIEKDSIYTGEDEWFFDINVEY